MNLTDIGQTILSNRKARKLTQQTLADRAGVSRYTIVKLENNQAGDIQFKLLSAILAELHLTLTVRDSPVSGVAVLGEDLP